MRFLLSTRHFELVVILFLLVVLPPPLVIVFDATVSRYPVLSRYQHTLYIV